MIIKYEERELVFDIEDMDTDQARAMERFGVPNLKALQDGIFAGDVSALTVCYWLAMDQSGEAAVRLDQVKFKPAKFLAEFGKAQKAEVEAAKKAAEAAGKAGTAE